MRALNAYPYCGFHCLSDGDLWGSLYGVESCESFLVLFVNQIEEIEERKLQTFMSQ
jgi:hypothetical protein